MKVLIAEQQRRIRQALRLLVEEELGAEVNEIASEDQLLSGVRSWDPDLVVFPWKMAQRDLSALISNIRSESSEAKIIVLVRSKSEAESSLIAGAHGAVEHMDPPAKLKEIISVLVGRGADGSAAK